MLLIGCCFLFCFVPLLLLLGFFGGSITFLYFMVGLLFVLFGDRVLVGGFVAFLAEVGLVCWGYLTTHSTHLLRLYYSIKRPLVSYSPLSYVIANQTTWSRQRHSNAVTMDAT